MIHPMPSIAVDLSADQILAARLLWLCLPESTGSESLPARRQPDHSRIRHALQKSSSRDGYSVAFEEACCRSVRARELLLVVHSVLLTGDAWLINCQILKRRS